MTALPLSIGIIHFTGIGGIGMSGIAEIMHELGLAEDIEALRAAGILS